MTAIRFTTKHGNFIYARLSDYPELILGATIDWKGEIYEFTSRETDEEDCTTLWVYKSLQSSNKLTIFND